MILRPCIWAIWAVRYIPVWCYSEKKLPYGLGPTQEVPVRHTVPYSPTSSPVDDVFSRILAFRWREMVYAIGIRLCSLTLSSSRKTCTYMYQQRFATLQTPLSLSVISRHTFLTCILILSCFRSYALSF